MEFLPAEVIKKKRNGGTLSEEEISTFIQSYTKGSIPDYQMSALLMAIYFKGMSETETLALTQTMMNSGIVIRHEKVHEFKVDKHSTGGVGDKTSMILGPIVSAVGLAVPMIAGRGLGHTGGTLDKLESIPGFNTQLTLEQFKETVLHHRFSLIGQTKDICPADKKIYALRDVTATIESLPLICASIMSKKLAEGIDGLVLDVKFGSGAFMKDAAQAEELARRLMSIAQGSGKKVAALLTNMDQPLGRYAGNSLEIDECIAILKNERFTSLNGKDAYEDTRELSLQLSAYMLWLGGSCKSVEDAYHLAQVALGSGRAYEKFQELCRSQSGRLTELPKPKQRHEVFASESGYIVKMNTETIGVVGIQIKAGRAVASDVIEPTAGIEFHFKVGDKVEKGQPLFTLFGADLNLLQSVEKTLRGSVTMLETETKPQPLILKTLI
jgi:pyrimidine-nucleoside phosphorylase